MLLDGSFFTVPSVPPAGSFLWSNPDWQITIMDILNMIGWLKLNTIAGFTINAVWVSHLKENICSYRNDEALIVPGSKKLIAR